MTFYIVTETLYVLVNEGSSVGAYDLDLIALFEVKFRDQTAGNSNTKRFFRDLPSAKVKRICVLVAEDE